MHQTGNEFPFNISVIGAQPETPLSTHFPAWVKINGQILSWVPHPGPFILLENWRPAAPPMSIGMGQEFLSSLFLIYLRLPGSWEMTEESWWHSHWCSYLPNHKDSWYYTRQSTRRNHRNRCPQLPVPVILKGMSSVPGEFTLFFPEEAGDSLNIERRCAVEEILISQKCQCPQKISKYTAFIWEEVKWKKKEIEYKELLGYYQANNRKSNTHENTTCKFTCELWEASFMRKYWLTAKL